MILGACKHKLLEVTVGDNSLACFRSLFAKHCVRRECLINRYIHTLNGRRSNDGRDRQLRGEKQRSNG